MKNPEFTIGALAAAAVVAGAPFVAASYASEKIKEAPVAVQNFAYDKNINKAAAKKKMANLKSKITKK